MGPRNDTPTSDQIPDDDGTRDQAGTAKGSRRMRILGGIIGAFVGLTFGVLLFTFMSSDRWFGQQADPLRWVLLAGSTAVGVGGAVGATRNAAVQGLGGAIGAGAPCAFLSCVALILRVANLVDPDRFGLMFLFGTVTLFLSPFVGWGPGLVLGLIGTRIGGKDDNGLLVGSLGTSIGAGLGWFLGVLVIFVLAHV
jgi:hypothetical protein